MPAAGIEGGGHSGPATTGESVAPILDGNVPQPHALAITTIVPIMPADSWGTQQ